MEKSAISLDKSPKRGILIIIKLVLTNFIPDRNGSMLFSLRSGYRNAAVFRIGTGNRTIPEFLLFRESVTLRGTDPTLRRPVERGLCAAVRDGRKPANGLWPSGTPVQRHCGKHTDGQTAFREPASIHFSRTVTAEPSGRGTAARPPYWVRAPTHRQVRSFHSFLSDCRKTVRPYLLFPRPVR